MLDLADPPRDTTALPTAIVSPLRALVAANAVSLSANVAITVAVPWLVLTMTGSATLTGIVVLVGAVGAMTGGLLAGRIVDWIGPVRTSAVADLFSGIAVAPLPILIAFDALAFWQIVVLAALGTLVDSAGSAARQSLVPVAADLGGVGRERANAMFTSAEHVGYLLGAPTAGLLIAGVGVAGTLGLAVAGFGTSAYVVVRFVTTPAQRSADPSSRSASIRDVMAFIWSDPALRALVVFPTLAVTIIGPLVPMVLPVLARQGFGDPIALGIMVAGYGAGGLLGATGYGYVGARLSRRRLYRIVFIVWPTAFAAIAVSPALPMTVISLLVLGTAAGALVPMQATIRQERSPARLLPGVVGLSTASIPVAAPIGVLVTGILIDALDLHQTLLLMTGAAAAIGTAVVTSRATRDFDPGRCATKVLAE